MSWELSIALAFAAFVWMLVVISRDVNVVVSHFLQLLAFWVVVVFMNFNVALAESAGVDNTLVRATVAGYKISLYAAFIMSVVTILLLIVQTVQKVKT